MRQGDPGAPRRGAAWQLLPVLVLLVLPVAASLAHAGDAAASATPTDAGSASGDAATLAASASPLQTVEVEATRLNGPDVAPSGNSQYTVTQQGIANLPTGESSQLSDVLAQMPGVSIDQNQQVHIRDTEGPQFQYQIDGLLVPLDINTNPPFLAMINPMFISRMNLLTGVLPARYSYATGGVIDIQTRQGCADGGGAVSLFAGQRDTLQPSAEYSGCDGSLSYYVNGVYNQSNSAFSSATPGPNAYHDRTRSGQLFSVASAPLRDTVQFKLIASFAASDNQLPNVPGLTPQFSLAGGGSLAGNGLAVGSPPPSADIDSDLNFRDALLIAALQSSPGQTLSWQLAYSFHTITQAFRPDAVGELAYQGVASTATHRDLDHALQGDAGYRLGHHALGAGFYVGRYGASIEDQSLVFPIDAGGAQASAVPLAIRTDAQALNWLSGIYLDDLWTIGPRLRASIGLRWDDLTGFTRGNQFDPTANLSYQPAANTTLHAGFARYFQVPLFQGISPGTPDAFAGTTAAGPPGIVSPLIESDDEWDIGLLQRLTSRWTLSEDNYYESAHHHLDTGQFGVVPIFAPFNYRTGHLWGSELTASYQAPRLSAYANLTVGSDREKGIATGQFNFDPAELAYIDSHYITLDHQPLIQLSAGLSAEVGRFSFSVDGLYNTGLRAGFADLQKLPEVLQINLGAQRSVAIRGVGTLIERLSLVNALDRINLIRPAKGIGIFQAAYGPRATLYGTLSLQF